VTESVSTELVSICRALVVGVKKYATLAPNPLQQFQQQRVRLL
jgi:hypothetical protein